MALLYIHNRDYLLVVKIYQIIKCTKKKKKMSMTLLEAVLLICCLDFWFCSFGLVTSVTFSYKVLKACTLLNATYIKAQFCLCFLGHLQVSTRISKVTYKASCLS